MQTSERAHGLVLRTRPFTETSLIVNWLTPEFGRLSTVAKGARRTKSPFRGKLDLFYEGDFSFQRSRRSELHTLREIVLRETNTALRHELGYLQQASYCSALIEQTTETQTPIPEIYQLFYGFLQALPKQPPRPRTIFAFELKLLGALGLAPDVEESNFSVETRALVNALTHTDWERLSDLRATAAQARAVRQFLHGFLIFHLGKIPRGRGNAVEN
ncbi:MAG TPA: DNA repair protein RecO [Verrucomicrobiae bacterium]|jgi:DNA repair protein RecO (recombination protein O)|nr:DNA repair protein RecO [Verrucomicrobiae bacterium]